MGFASAHCIRRLYGAMADVKNTPFRRISLRFYKTLRQSGGFPSDNWDVTQPNFLRFGSSPSEFLTILQKLRQQLMALENKLIAIFP